MNTNPTPRAIEAILVDLPTIRAHKLAMATMTNQTLVIVRITCSDGVVGIGEATTIGGLAYGEQSPEGIKSAVDDYIAPLLRNSDVTQIGRAMQRISGAVQGNSFAKAAVEIALLDAQGKRLGLPVHALLGGAVRDTLPVLWTLASGDPARDVDEAQSLIEARRHNVFKLKIGSHSLAEDIAHVQAIRRGLGNDVMLTCDVNQAWDEPTAMRGIAALESAGVGLIEQPVARRNRRALKRLADRFDVAIMADEAVHDAIDAFDLAAAGAADVYALKVSQAGGLWQTLRAAAVADAAGVGIYGGTLLEGSIGSVAAAHAFAACPQLAWGTELFGPLLLKDDVVVQRPAYRDFEMQLPQTAGLGVQLDADKLAFYRRDKTTRTVAVTA
ncbi:MAG: muconate/chloromuconate family cycloisomerase [Burkholderiales bacterium]